MDWLTTNPCILVIDFLLIRTASSGWFSPQNGSHDARNVQTKMKSTVATRGTTAYLPIIRNTHGRYYAGSVDGRKKCRLNSYSLRNNLPTYTAINSFLIQRSKSSQSTTHQQPFPSNMVNRYSDGMNGQMREIPTLCRLRNDGKWLKRISVYRSGCVVRRF